jgi:hypothetical protein
MTKARGPKLNKRTGEHVKACRCNRCHGLRILEYREKVLRMTERPQPTREKLIPVRAHFRRDPRFAKKMPELRPMFLDVALAALGRGVMRGLSSEELDS